MTKNILYIHGYGSKGESRTAQALREKLGERYRVFSPPFSNDVHYFSETQRNINMVLQIIRTEKINILVASSMGAFVALNFSGMSKVLINPCMLPSEQIPLRIAPNISTEEIEKYKAQEEAMIVDYEERMATYAFFSNHDELFSYKKRFMNRYNPKHAFSLEDGHRISVENVHHHVAPLVIKLLNKNNLYESDESM